MGKALKTFCFVTLFCHELINMVNDQSAAFVDRINGDKYISCGQILVDYLESGETEIAADFVDFNVDGIKELVVMTDDAHNNLADIYAYNSSDDRFESIGDEGFGENGYVIYYPRKNTIYSEYNGPNYVYEDYYSLIDNKAVMQNSIRIDYNEDGNKTYTSYVPYEKNISEKDYKSINEKYKKYGELEYITYSKSTHLKTIEDIEDFIAR